MGSGEGKRRRERGEKGRERGREGRRRRRPRKRRENLFNHIDYFNLHPTHRLRKQKMENLILQIPPLVPLPLIVRVFPHAEGQAAVFSQHDLLKHNSASSSLAQPKTQ